MKHLVLSLLGCASLAFAPGLEAKILTVTTSDNANPPAGQLSLAQALADLAEGDEIRFNLTGPGPHYIVTPSGGYPQITAHRVIIDGYSQPGSAANTNSILAANNAQIRIFLDSREAGRSTVLNVDGYGPTQSAILGFVGATNVTVRGLGFLGRLVTTPTVGDPAVNAISFAAKSKGGQVSGCWFGVDADRTGVIPANAGVTGLRFREGAAVFHVDDVVVGVRPGSANPNAEFNVFAGMQLPILMEGKNLRVAGNFIGVLPSGTNDFNNALAESSLPSLGAIHIGRDGSGTVIGTDGDGVNDAQERNVFGGVIPRSVAPVTEHGYDRYIEFYGGGERRDVVIAGNYFGIGVDGATRFTTGAALVSGLTANARVGSDFDGRSDLVEGNFIVNNFPPQTFTPETVVRDFLANVGLDAVISVRGNILVNNFIPPVSPLRDNGTFAEQYYGKAISLASEEIVPILSTNTSVARLIGTAPLAETFFYPTTIIDLYVADPEGLAQRAPDWPNGWIQGRTYLGSFVEGSADDLNPEAGAFAFDLSRLNIAQGTQLTVTANFSQAAPGTSNAATLTTLFSNVIAAGEAVVEDVPLSIARANGSVQLNWSGIGWVLQSAPAVTGPWQDVATTGTSHLVPIGAGNQFFRLIRR